MKIYRDVLSAIQSETGNGEIVFTRVQQRTNVPFDRLKTYITELVALGLIQSECSPQLTEKGDQYLAEYEKVLDFMKRMGLAYREKS
ncbi:MAG: winged helix-turn-helix domain-containing protein [Candidatus Bathyarchaeia archaeon]